MDYKRTLKKIEKVFIEMGFVYVTINNTQYLKYKEHYCKVTFLQDWSVFVIESADNIHDAQKGLLEDGDLFDVNLPEDELLSNIKDELIRDFLQ